MGAPGGARGVAPSTAGAASVATPRSAFGGPWARWALARRRFGPGGGRMPDCSDTHPGPCRPGLLGTPPAPAGRFRSRAARHPPNYGIKLTGRGRRFSRPGVIQSCPCQLAERAATLQLMPAVRWHPANSNNCCVGGVFGWAAPGTDSPVIPSDLVQAAVAGRTSCRSVGHARDPGTDGARARPRPPQPPGWTADPLPRARPRRARAGRDRPRGSASPPRGGGDPGPLREARARPAPRLRRASQAARPTRTRVGAVTAT